MQPIAEVMPIFYKLKKIMVKIRRRKKNYLNDENELMGERKQRGGGTEKKQRKQRRKKTRFVYFVREGVRFGTTEGTCFSVSRETRPTGL